MKVIGPHERSPWKEIVITETYLDRFDVPEEFELLRMAEPKLVGSLVAMTWANRGRLFVSRERGPILSVIDDNGDGVFDRVVEYTNEVKNCQGLCTVGDDLYAVGSGPHGVGLYRLPDKNHDDKADEVQFLVKDQGGMGDHGPHDVVFGPDGWLYRNMGNHSHVLKKPEPTSAVRDYDEDYLLVPKFEDAGGHAAGIKAPGGTIWRFTPDAKHWWLETNGFRNEYDIAFNAAGDLFSFDSDMEWDVGAYWYRPVRVTHCTAGAEFGWRSGAAKWPAYYFDSLPGTVDVGARLSDRRDFLRSHAVSKAVSRRVPLLRLVAGPAAGLPLEENGGLLHGDVAKRSSRATRSMSPISRWTATGRSCSPPAGGPPKGASIACGTRDPRESRRRKRGGATQAAADAVGLGPGDRGPREIGGRTQVGARADRRRPVARSGRSDSGVDAAQSTWAQAGGVAVG